MIGISFKEFNACFPPDATSAPLCFVNLAASFPPRIGFEVPAERTWMSSPRLLILTRHVRVSHDLLLLLLLLHKEESTDIVC